MPASEAEKHERIERRAGQYVGKGRLQWGGLPQIKENHKGGKYEKMKEEVQETVIHEGRRQCASQE